MQTAKVNTRALAGKRIGLFGKGGAGKSTTVALLSKSLQARGYRVCVLDADSTNIGLSQALGIAGSPVSLLDYFGGMVFSGGAVTCPVDDPTPLAGAELTLETLPPQYYSQSPEGIIMLVAGKIGGQGPGAGCDGPVAKIARDFRIHVQGEPLVTLVDFKAGFEDSARGAITGLDWAIVVVDPTSASVGMAANMKEMVSQIKAGVLPATSHLESPELVEWANKIFTQASIKDVWFVLSRVQNTEVEEYMRQGLREKGIEPIGVIYEAPSVSLSWLKGEPIEIFEADNEIQRIIDKVEQQVERVAG